MGLFSGLCNNITSREVAGLGRTRPASKAGVLARVPVAQPAELPPDPPPGNSSVVQYPLPPSYGARHPMQAKLHGALVGA